MRPKRAPRLPAPTKPASAVADLKLPEVVQRYAEGASLRELQEQTGVGRMTLYRWMLAGVGDKNFHDLVTNCLTNRIAEADDELDAAIDPCAIARAREKARFARMDLERRRPQLYGQKIEQAIDARLIVEIVKFGGAAVQQSNASVTQKEPKLIESSTCDVT